MGHPKEAGTIPRYARVSVGVEKHHVSSVISSPPMPLVMVLVLVLRLRLRLRLMLVLMLMLMLALLLVSH